MDSQLAEIKISKIWKGEEQSEGQGARVIRLVDSSNYEDVDPFLMFDFYNTKLPGGFPDHPHRGFETITYQLEGIMNHEDFKGHKGQIKPGDVQWMTAGKGIVHAEMPNSFTEFSRGFQLWINLSKENKMVEPCYQEFPSEKIPVFTDKSSGSSVKVICGTFSDIEGPCKSKTPACYYDVNIKSGSEFELPIGEDKNGYIFVYSGSISINGKTVDTYYASSFKAGSGSILKVTSSGKSGGSFLVMAAKPLNEPCRQYGPFVMNTQDEIRKAFDDYQNAKNGFEGADKWESEIQYLKNKK